jgi:hypothetical protein
VILLAQTLQHRLGSGTWTDLGVKVTSFEVKEDDEESAVGILEHINQRLEPRLRRSIKIYFTNEGANSSNSES